MGIKLLLFDVDATLLHSGGAGRRSMNRAFKELFGVDDAFAGVVPDGNTDPRIFREIIELRGLQLDDHDAALASIAPLYIRCLQDEMPASPTARVMPGVHALLESLALRDDVLLGLLTGNLEEAARIKLERFHLNRFFSFGAFASDHEDRDALVPIAVSRGERNAGRPIGIGPHVVVIGDSPRDVACALAHGVSAVGVGTGSFTPQQLLDAGAHLAFDDLSDAYRVAAAIENLAI